MSTINLDNLDIPINFKPKATKSTEAILNERFGFNQEQIEVITSFKRENDDPIVSLDYPDFFYEVCFLFKNQGYDEVIKMLKEIANDYNVKLNGHFILNTRFFEKEQTEYQKEISRLRDTIEHGVESVHECPRCHSKTVSEQVSSRQRASDEAQIFILTCDTCKLTWKS